MNLMNRVPLRLLIVIVLQTAVLAVMIGMKQWTLNTGTPIVLETAPIDPRSLFRGDYVRLSYKINSLTLDELDGADDFAAHGRIYVLLKKGEPYWQPVSLHHELPPAQPDHVAIKGEVEYVRLKVVSVRYGIENYFVPEGEGMALERPSAGETVSIRVAVDRNGNAGIKAVLVNGEARYTESLF